MDNDRLKNVLLMASNINDTEEFKEILVEMCEAHACHIRVSEGTGSGQRATFKISSKVSREVILEYFSAIAKRLGTKRDEKSEDEKVYTPSDLWKEVHTSEDNGSSSGGGHYSKEVHGTIVGYDGEADDLDKCFALVEWGEGEPSKNDKERDNFEVDDNIETIEFEKSDLEEGRKSCEKEIHQNEVNCPEKIPEEWIEWIASTAEYHLCGDKPVSFISIPVAIKPNPYGKPQQYFSVEIIWFGKPVSDTAIENLYKVSILTKYVGARLLMEPEEETLFEHTLSIAKNIDTNQHDYEEGKSERFLKRHIPNSGEAIDNLRKGLESKALWKGLKPLALCTSSKSQTDFKLESLYAVAAIHSLKSKQNIERSIKVPDDYSPHEPTEFNFNYKMWARFIEYFHEQKNKYGGYIKNVSLEKGTLKLEVDSVDNSAIEESLETLGKNIADIWLSRPKGGSNVSRAFLDAFLSNQKNTPYFPFSFESSTRTINKESKDEKDISLEIIGEKKVINIKVHVDDE
jgi:hypothetical protein